MHHSCITALCTLGAACEHYHLLNNIIVMGAWYAMNIGGEDLSYFWY